MKPGAKYKKDLDYRQSGDKSRIKCGITDTRGRLGKSRLPRPLRGLADPHSGDSIKDPQEKVEQVKEQKKVRDDGEAPWRVGREH